ncbi:hypothetical protein [Hyphobacterium sp.]|jgi:hypothetical protein|uniref:hypothetical protein n=1 Tax=Hyphobacterium sp. TaxID=2004662 RepID=UPI003BA97701
MAKPKENNPVAMAGLLLAAGVFVSTLYLNYQHAPSRLNLADNPDGTQMLAPTNTVAHASAE